MYNNIFLKHDEPSICEENIIRKTETCQTENLLDLNYEDAKELKIMLGKTLYRLKESEEKIVLYIKKINVLERIIKEQKDKISLLSGRIDNSVVNIATPSENNYLKNQ